MRSTKTTPALLDLKSASLSQPISTKNNTAQSDKKHRARSTFSSGITASLALPDKTTPIEDDCTTNTIITPLPAQSFTSSLFALFATHFTPDKKKVDSKIDYKPQLNTGKPVLKNMEILEEKYHKIKNLEKKHEADDLLLKKIELVEEEIKEHASRRVDLFFYLLIAVHGKQIIISKDFTSKQHGKGSSKAGTHACHSSLFPSVKFETPPSTLSWLLSFFTTSTPCPTLSGTHFAETLNMTVELPINVNSFDGHLEGRFKSTQYIENFLNLLNKVSKNQMTPKEAMNNFMHSLNTFFSHYEEKYILTEKTDTPKTNKKIWECEKKGTLRSANKDMKSISDDYLYLMLRLTSSEISKVKKNPAAITEYYKRVQDEIFNSKTAKGKMTKSRHVLKPSFLK